VRALSAILIEAEGGPRRRAATSGVHRLWAARIVLVCCCSLLPLAFLEATIRLFGPILPGNYATGTFLTAHPVYARFHVPNFDGWVKTSEFTARVTTNTHGLRGPERDYPKPPGVKRVLVLGDSFVEAAQVSEAEGLVTRLEDRLNARGQQRYEVLNAGVGGWGTGQQYLFLQHEGHRYDPDLVVVVLYLGNDVFDNSWILQGRPGNPREPYFVFTDSGAFKPMPFRHRKPEEVPPAIDALRRHTMLWNIFETGVLQKTLESDGAAKLRAARPNVNKMIIHSTRSSKRQDDAWRTTLTLLQHIGRFGAERGMLTAIVVVPAFHQVSEAGWERVRRQNDLEGDIWSPTHPNDVLAANANLVGVPMLDLLPHFWGATDGTGPLYFPRDGHWTAAGHAVAARAVEEFLVDRRLVP